MWDYRVESGANPCGKETGRKDKKELFKIALTEQKVLITQGRTGPVGRSVWLTQDLRANFVEER